MATKEKVKQGKHLTVTTATDGSVTLKWDWVKLLAEVRAATSVDATIDTELLNATKSKKDLVKETEVKVTKTRAKKTPAAKKSAK